MYKHTLSLACVSCRPLASNHSCAEARALVNVSEISVIERPETIIVVSSANRTVMYNTVKVVKEIVNEYGEEERTED